MAPEGASSPEDTQETPGTRRGGASASPATCQGRGLSAAPPREEPVRVSPGRGTGLQGGASLSTCVLRLVGCTGSLRPPSAVGFHGLVSPGFCRLRAAGALLEVLNQATQVLGWAPSPVFLGQGQCLGGRTGTSPSRTAAPRRRGQRNRNSLRLPAGAPGPGASPAGRRPPHLPWQRRERVRAHPRGACGRRHVQMRSASLGVRCGVCTEDTGLVLPLPAPSSLHEVTVHLLVHLAIQGLSLTLLRWPWNITEDGSGP